MDFWEKTNGTFGVLDIFTKHLCEKKMNVFWVYMPFKDYFHLYFQSFPKISLTAKRRRQFWENFAA